MINLRDSIPTNQWLSAPEYWNDLISRVEAGISFLNELDPNWPNLIDLSNFDIRFGDRCICGQVFVNGLTEKLVEHYAAEAEVSDNFYNENYYDGYSRFEDIMGGNKGIEFGFCVQVNHENVHWDDLATLWITYVKSEQTEK
jgi:hypothetical protein